MAKWADYLISGVKYSTGTKTYISNLRVHEDEGDKVGTSSELSKNEVVKKINSNYTFVTIFKNSEGRWSKGEDVRVYSRNGSSYLRTDSNSIEEDNLGELPEF
jgi:hypothetical protein